jgi:hypothetical protein
MKQLILSVIVISALVSCGPSTKIEKRWMEPGASINQSAANKALVIAIVKDEVSRRVIEDQLVKRLNGKGDVSYNKLSTEAMKDASGAPLNKILTDGKYTHILMMRLADVEKETNYVPGTTTAYYGGYGRYYGYGASFYSSPGYYVEDKNYFIETTVYSVSPDKLLWTGTTKTVNPSKIEKTVNDIADVVSDKMKKDGFLK